jgi:DNA-binding winged helix-turn-helix (wHTH) protein
LRRLFQWGEFELDEAGLELRRRGDVVSLHGKPYALLAYLVQHPDRVIARAELERAIWPDVVVSETSLSTALYEVRRALGDHDRRGSCIQTVRGYGYRFSAQVVKVEEAVPSATPRAAQQALLVGRDEVLEQLLEVVAGAGRGEGRARVALLHGPSGIGKTSVALRLAERAGLHGVEASVARGHRDEGTPPFWPWIEVLRGLSESRGDAAIRDAAASGIDTLVRLMPGLGERIGVAPREAGPHTAHERFQFFDSVAGCLMRLSRARPLLVVLDDLHAMDTGSLRLLSFIAHDPRSGPLVVLGTYRELRHGDTPQESALRQLSLEPRCRSLELGGLARPSIAALVEHAVGQPPSAPLLDRIESSTQGNPLYVTEMCRALRARGPGVLAEDAIRSVPASLRETMRARLEGLSELARDLLEAIAATGPRASLKLLLRVLDAGVEPTLRALGEAEDAGFIQRGAEHGTYHIQPRLLRETLYDDLNTARRMELHLAIARGFESLAEGDPRSYLAELSHHFAEAAALDQGKAAVLYGMRAARCATETFAHDDAAVCLRRALAAHDFSEPRDPLLRCELLADLAKALAESSAPVDEVRLVAQEAIELARRHGGWTLLARAARDFALYSIDQDAVLLTDLARAPLRAPGLQDPLEEALRHLPAEERALRARMHLALTALFTQMGEVEHAARELALAEPLCEACDDAWLRIELLFRRCYLLPVLDRMRERIELGRQLTALSQSRGFPVGEAFGRVTEASLALQAGDRRQAENAAARIERLDSEARVFFAAELLFAWRSLIAQLDARFEDAERWSLEGVRLTSGFNYSHERSLAMYGLQSWWNQIALGRAEAILPRWEAYVRAFPGVRYARFLLARLYAETGRLDCARAELEHVDAAALRTLPPDDNWLFFAAVSADVCSAVGDRARAAAILDLLSPYVERVAVAGWVGVCSGSIARQAGSLSALLGRGAQVDTLFALALRQNGALGSPALSAWTEYDLARALLCLGRAEDADRIDVLLAAARDRAASLGMRGIEAGAGALLDSRSRRRAAESASGTRSASGAGAAP